MISSLKTTAETLASLLDTGMVKTEKVIAWVDATIAEMDDPPIPLIDASLFTRDVNALVNSLRALPGKTDQTEALRLTFYYMRESLAEDAELAPKIARALFRMAMDGQIPEGGDGAMFHLDNAFSLADEGIYGDPLQVRQELQDFLDEHSRPS